VIVAEDSALLREGIVRLLAEEGYDVVAAVGDADELLAAVQIHQPDAAVVDVRMPRATPMTGSVPLSRSADAGRRPPCSSCPSGWSAATPTTSSARAGAGSVTC
jgi:DNA-binding NarL/FixJ family response regulator